MHPDDSCTIHTIVGWYQFTNSDYPVPFWGHIVVNEDDDSLTGLVYDEYGPATLSGNININAGSINFTKTYGKINAVGFEPTDMGGDIQYTLKQFPDGERWEGTYDNSREQRDCGCLIAPPLFLLDPAGLQEAPGSVIEQVNNCGPDTTPEPRAANPPTPLGENTADLLQTKEQIIKDWLNSYGLIPEDVTRIARHPNPDGWPPSRLRSEFPYLG